MNTEALEQRDKVLRVMRDAKFTTDMPGVIYGQPDMVEFRYGGDGGELLIRSVGGLVRVVPLSGSWSEIPEDSTPVEDSDFKDFVVLTDPRHVLQRLEDVVVEEKGVNRILRGIIGGLMKADSLETYFIKLPDRLNDLTLEERVKAVSPSATLEIDEQDRVLSMEVQIFTGGEDIQEDTKPFRTLHFFYQ